MVNILGKELEKNQEQQLKIIVFLLIAGIIFYFNVYLPEQQRQQLEMQIQSDINLLQTIQPQDYSNMLTKLQGYSKWEREGNSIQQEALENMKKELEKAINWLIQAEKHLVDENQQARTQEEAEKKKKEEEMIRKKKFHWRRKPKSWADDYLATDKDKYDSKIEEQGMEKASAFNSFAHYKIHFPPGLWKNLNQEQQKKAKASGYGELNLDEETKQFEFNDDIQDWYDKTYSDPSRGKPDPGNKKDNNALFYGTEGTGKTSIVRKLTYETDCYPMIEVKGSTLSPNKLDSDIGIAPLEKFIFTICDIEHALEDDYNFKREKNGEVRFILFVDEADLVSRESRYFDPIKLAFLKECMEQVSKEKQTENLWIFATNHLELIERAVYRPGRLSNPLDFSWTLGDFMRYSRKAGITNQFPSHWVENPVLNKEDNKWVNRFNMPSFETYFLGKKLDGTPIPNAIDFWKRFITNHETQKILNEEKEFGDKGEEIIKKKGIQWGEFFEFFWNLKDTGQLQHFDGKFISPKPPKIEDIVEKTIAKVDETLAIRLEEVNNRISEIREEISSRGGEYIGTLNMGITNITSMLTEIGKKI